jgi:hypothetical protein
MTQGESLSFSHTGIRIFFLEKGSKLIYGTPGGIGIGIFSYMVRAAVISPSAASTARDVTTTKDALCFQYPEMFQYR